MKQKSKTKISNNGGISKTNSVMNTRKQSTKGGIPKASGNKTTLKYKKGGKTKC